jgi:hypothetical protein
LRRDVFGSRFFSPVFRNIVTSMCLFPCQAMFAAPSILAAAEAAAAPLLAKIEAKKLADNGGDAVADANSGRAAAAATKQADDEDDDEEEGGWETESGGDGDDGSDGDEEAPTLVASGPSEPTAGAFPPPRKSSLWPVGWAPLLGERADALLSPWAAVALFPLDPAPLPRRGAPPRLPSSAPRESPSLDAATEALLPPPPPWPLPLFRGDLPHSCLPSHALAVQHYAAGASGGRGSFLGASLQPLPADQGGHTPPSLGGFSQSSRCFVAAARGRRARGRELSRRFGSPPSPPAATAEGECACVRCAWEAAALPAPSVPPGPLDPTALSEALSEAPSEAPSAAAVAAAAALGLLPVARARSDAAVGEAAAAAAVTAISAAAAVGANSNDDDDDNAWELLRRLASLAMHQERYPRPPQSVVRLK